MKHLKFTYLNWKGDEHEYVIAPDGVGVNIEYHDHHAQGNYESHWLISGLLVTRDGDPRHEMGNRRRSFVLTRMKSVEEVEA